VSGARPARGRVAVPGPVGAAAVPVAGPVGELPVRRGTRGSGSAAAGVPSGVSPSVAGAASVPVTAAVSAPSPAGGGGSSPAGEGGAGLRVASSATAVAVVAAVAGDAPNTGARWQPMPEGSDPAGTAPAKLRPRPYAAPSMAAAPVKLTPQQVVHNTVQKFFLDFSDLVRRLPDGPLHQLAANLEGALLIVRKTLFRHAPGAGPVQLTSSAQQITGVVNGYDAHGDALSYSVVKAPQLGTISLEADGSYVYKPGADFAGSDSFTVEVTSAGRGINLFNLVAGQANSTMVAVAVGEAGPTHPFALGSSAPATGSVAPSALYLLGTPAGITIAKNAQGKLTGTVTLSLPADTAVGWTQNGVDGEMSLADAAQRWKTVEAANGDIRFGLDFFGANGANGTAEYTVILDQTTAARNASGGFVFSGTLLDPATVNGKGIDSVYDITGSDFQSGYANFRKTFKLDGASFSGVSLNIGSADVYVDSYSVSQYAATVQGTTEADTGSAPPTQAAAPATPALAASTSQQKTSDDVFTLVGDGFGGYFAGTGKGQVLHYLADGTKVMLHKNDWDSPVTAMILYGDYNKTPVYQTLTVTGDAVPYAASRVPVAAGINWAATSRPATGQLRLSGWTDPSGGLADLSYVYKVDTKGKVVFEDVADVMLSDGTTIIPPRPLAGASMLDSGHLQVVFDEPLESGSLSASVTYDAPTGEYTSVPGLVVGLGDGAVQKWIPGISYDDPSTAAGHWVELANTGWNSDVTALIPYKGRPDVCEGGCDGFLVGLADGAVEQYNEARYGAGKPGWWELHDSGWQSAVRKIMPFGTDSAGLPTFVVGLANGAVQRWNNGPTYGWTELASSIFGDIYSGQAMIPAPAEWGADNFLVGQADSKVVQHNASGWSKELNQPGNSGGSWPEKDAANVMVPYGPGGFLVGLTKGSIYEWKANGGGFISRRNGDSQTLQQQKLDGDRVNVLMPYGSGFVAGFASGRVEYWDGTTMAVWQDGQSQGFFGNDKAEVRTMTVVGSNVVVGLKNGAIEQYTPGIGSAGTWTVTRQPYDQGDRSYGYKPDLETLSAAYQFIMGGVPGFEDLSKAALNKDLLDLGLLDYTFNHVDTAPNPNEILGANDPIFGGPDGVAPSCAKDVTCNGQVYTWGMATPVSYYVEHWYQKGAGDWAIWQKGQGLGENLGQLRKGCDMAGLCVSVDAGVAAYGYVIVPHGLWGKLNPDRWSHGVNMAVTLGPALRMNLNTAIAQADAVTIHLTGDTPPTKQFLYEELEEAGTVSIEGVLSASAALSFPSQDATLDQYKGVYYWTSNMGWNSCGSKEAGNCTNGSWTPVDHTYNTTEGWRDFLTLQDVDIKLYINADLKTSWGIELPGKVQKIPVVGKLLYSYLRITPFVGLQNQTILDLKVPVHDGDTWTLGAPSLDITDIVNLTYGLELGPPKPPGPPKPEEPNTNTGEKTVDVVDAGGNKIGSRVEIRDAEGNLTSSTETTKEKLDGGGSREKTTSLVNDKDGTKTSTTTTTDYSGSREPTSSTVTAEVVGTDGKPTSSTEKTKSYDSDGRLTSSKETTKSYGADGTLVISTSSTETTNGKKTSETLSTEKRDANGKVTSAETVTDSYGADGKLTSSTTASDRYDNPNPLADGKKTSSTQSVKTYDGDGTMTAETGRTEFFDADGNSMGVREDYRDATTDRFSSYHPGGIPPEVPNASGPQKDWSVNSSLEAVPLVPVNSGGFESELGGPWSFEVKRYDATVDENLTGTEKTVKEVLTDPAGAVTGYRESVTNTEHVYDYKEVPESVGQVKKDVWKGTLVETRVTTREDVFDADRKIISSRDRFEIYDPKGNLISSETTARDSGTLQQTGKEVVNDPNGDVVGFIESQKATDADGSWRERTNSYDPSGSLTDIVETAKDVLSNADGDYAGYRRSLVSDSVDRSRSYDADGRLTSAVEIIIKPPIAVDAPVSPAPADGYVGQSRSTLANTYDGDGMLTGSRETTKEVLTDAEGKVIGYLELDRGADVDSWWQQTQNYDAKGKPQQGREMRNGRIEGQRYALADGNGVFVGYRETYSDAGVDVSRDYDSSGELTSSTEKYTHSDGSFTTETVTYQGGTRTSEVFSSGDYALSKIYDSRGFLTSTTEWQKRADGSYGWSERFYAKEKLPGGDARYKVISERHGQSVEEGALDAADNSD
jgi:hypothetical protein